jgi:hypothetical protein
LVARPHQKQQSAIPLSVERRSPIPIRVEDFEADGLKPVVCIDLVGCDETAPQKRRLLDL